MSKVAVLGVGRMGSRIAGRLLETGHEVIVWNRSPASTATLSSLGAHVAATPSDAATMADVLITMVSGAAALAEVTEAYDGVVAGAHDSLTVIEMSTVGPAAIRRLAEALPPGTTVLDAPVLGSIAEAEAGTLAILVGGAPGPVQEQRPLLAVLGTVVHVGPLGAGAAAKLVANATLFAAIASLGEALALGRELGLSDNALFEVLALTPLATQAKKRRAAIEDGKYPPRFTLKLARKDAELIRQEARAAGVELRLAEGARAWLADADCDGLGDHDYTAVLATVLRGPRGTRRSSSVDRNFAPDGLIIDLDGVVWLSGEPIDGAVEAVARLRDGIGRVLFLTNDPQSSRSEQAARLSAIGIPASVGDVITSGAATARYLATHSELVGSSALVVGSQALRQEIEQAGLTIVEPSQAASAQLVIVGGYEGFNYADLAAATTAIHHGAALYATGRDPVIPTLHGPRPATGAILAAIETAGTATATLIGKPEPHIFRMALEMLPECSDVVVVGDNLASDIVGAKRAGLFAILVLTGTATRRDEAAAAVQPDLVLPSLAAVAGELTARVSRTQVR